MTFAVTTNWRVDICLRLFWIGWVDQLYNLGRAVETIAARGRQFARLDAIASNAVLCRYYEQRGFRPLDTAILFAGIYTARLFERELHK